MIAYITQQGAKIIRQGKRLIVQGQDFEHTLFAWKLEQLLIFGNINVTQPALALILESNIDLAFFRYDGRYLGRLASNEPRNVFLRKKQFLLTDDPEFSLKLAKSIVYGKLYNQATLLARIKRTKNKTQAGDAAKIVRDFALVVKQAKNIDEVRGLEGIGASHYFQAYGLGFITDWGFYKRVRRPPTDPVNAVLSLLYTLLINRMYASVRQAHLDPYPGVLHSLEYGRQSLPLDLIEEFRPLIVDTLTLSLFNQKVLDWGDFEFIQTEQTCNQQEESDPIERAINDPIGQINIHELGSIADIRGEQISTDLNRPITKLPVMLTPPAFRRVLSAFSKKLESNFYHPVEEKNMSYDDALVSCARQYRKVLEGTLTEYKPLLLR